MSATSEFLSLSPVIIVERIEPCLPFWRETLGFETVAEVPGASGLGFSMMTNGGVTVMLQTRDSVREDAPSLADAGADASLFIKVKGLEALVPKLDPETVVLPRRTTFYGADEIAVRPHEGCVVCLAEFAE